VNVLNDRALATRQLATRQKEDAMLEIVWIILIGAVVGALAKFLMPGPDPGGFLMTSVLGMAGAIVATFLGRLIGLYGPGQGAGIIASIIGAVLVLFGYHQMRQRGA
jgi:uncharacterized membrane protein YeaQ/YmgE (transglycosylase-associated protein family)